MCISMIKRKPGTLLPAKPKAQTPTTIILFDPILIAEAFNEHFARIGKSLINKFNVDHDNALPILSEALVSFFFVPNDFLSRA